MTISTVTAIYRFFISLRLSVVLLILLTADLGLGYIFMQGNTLFYEPMNEVGLRRWLFTYGTADPQLSAWFFVLLFLLFLLVVNTLFCTFDKLYHLFNSGRIDFRKRSVRRKLSIHLMHVAMVLLLMGYLISYTTAEIHNSLIMRVGETLEIPNSDIRLELVSMEFVPYRGDRNKGYIGRYIDVSAQLKIKREAGEFTRKFSVNNPAGHGGYSFFLQSFNPRQKGGFNPIEYITIDIRRDPGARFTFMGMAAFILGFLGFVFFRSPRPLLRRDVQ